MADILIRGMELPTDKGVEIMVFPNGYVGVYDVRGRYLAHARAFPLPKGHGKLGDLDAIVKRLNETEADFNKKKFYQGACWFHVIAELLKKAPTIIEAEGVTEQ